MQGEAEKLWFQFGKGLSELICRRTGHADHCHDILHDVYIRMFRQIDKVGKAENVGAYLNRLACNTVTDFQRRNKAAAEIDDPFDIGDEPVIINVTAELADCCLRPMIDTLPAIYREALVLTELEGMSQKDLALKLGISETGARSRVQRAREKLKAVILDCCHYEFDRYGNILSCEKNPDCCK